MSTNSATFSYSLYFVELADERTLGRQHLAHDVRSRLQRMFFKTNKQTINGTHHNVGFGNDLSCVQNRSTIWA